MRVGAILLAAAFTLAPLGARAADLVVWWEKGFNPADDEAAREIIAAFEHKTGKRVEFVQHSQEDMPPSAHVARTTVEVDGEEKRIFRRNVAYGGVTDNGTAFVGFAQDQWRLAEMLRRMAGATDRVRDGLTHWMTPLTGAYYTVPAVEALARFAPAEG